MKRKLAAALLFLFAAVACAACAAGKANVTGVWSCELYGSEQILEFTDDGRFIDRTSFTENRYRIERGRIVVYVEDEPGSELSFDYKVEGDTLTFGGAEYTKIVPTDADGAELTD